MMDNKTEKVQQLILNEILEGKYDENKKVPSERELSEKLKISRVTVRRGYEELAKSGIISKRSRSGSYFDTSFVVNTKYPEMVAVLASLNDYFALEFVDALERTLRQRDIFLVIRQTDKDPEVEKKVAIDLMRRGITNLIVWASGDEYNAKFFSRLRQVGINLVFVDRMIPDFFADYVGSDNDHAIHSMIDDGLGKGRKEFVFFGYNNVNWSSFEEREKAFLHLCENKNLPFRMTKVPWNDRAAHIMDDHARDFIHRLPELPSYPLIEKYAHQCCDDDGVAVICVNDYIALQVKHILPGALVYGFDGLPEAVNAGIITYRHPMKEMAKNAMRLLLRQHEMASDWKPHKTYCAGTLIGASA